MNNPKPTNQILDFQPVIELLNKINSFNSYSGDYNGNTYILEINDNNNNRYTIHFNKYKIIISNNGISEHKMSSNFSGVIEFSKRFSQLTNDYEDYEIMVDRLEGLLYK